ncbi:leucine-rich repeat domain-containing protein [Tenacibaculum agarivorans]|uniref:leucine-rich repeat domain-containing protein n=1 Tax=Tenacibaculum agarivorans TaxID=1908389 RepID=UPI00094B870D|nr:hypothetical protein [Tenacibaculum agarivorans]
MTRKLLFNFYLILFLSLELSAQYTAIPDPAFEATLGFLGYDDTPADGQVPTANIINVRELVLNNTFISSLVGIEDFTGLTSLEVSNNNIGSIDVSKHIVLENLKIYNCSSLKTIVFGENKELIDLSITGTLVEHLDLSPFKSLTEINVSNNNLSYLNVQTGTSGFINNFNAKNNPNLSCILVDFSSFSSRWADDVDDGVTFSTADYCRYTQIPDTNFEARLGQLGYDDILGDGQVPTTLIADVEFLNLINRGINDLTGIEDFTALKTLRVERNNLQSLDVSQNLNLNALIASENHLNTLILGYSSLTILRGGDNQLTELDLRQNTALQNIDLTNNLLTSVNIQNENNTNITSFNILGNPNLTCIAVDDAAYSTTNWMNVDSQTSFTDDYCRYTVIPDPNFEARLDALGYDDIAGDGQVPTALIENITSLNISDVLPKIENISGIEDFKALERLNMDANAISKIDVSKNTNLIFLSCYSSGVQSLNISGLRQLEELNCGANSLLVSLDLSTNSNLKKLECNDTEIVSLDLSASPLLTYLDCNFNTALSELNVKNANNKNFTYFDIRSTRNLTCVLVDNATYSASKWTNIGTGVSFSDTYCGDYTTIEDANFEASLGALGYDNIPNDGQVPTEFISAVTSLNINNQSIVNLSGIEDFKALGELKAAGNSIRNINLKRNTNLVVIRLNNNPLQSIDLSENKKVKILNISDTEISLVNVSKNRSLEFLTADRTNISQLDVSRNGDLIELNVNENSNLERLTLGNINKLIRLGARDSKLTSLNLSKLKELNSLDLRNNNLKSLIIKNGNNKNIFLNTTGNPDLNCIVVDDASDFIIQDRWKKSIDNHTSLSNNYCRFTNILDSNFEATLFDAGYDNKSGDGKVPTALIENVISLDVTSKSISDLTGIEDFTALETLQCASNGLTSLDISKNKNLISLNAVLNQISDIDVRENLKLESLIINRNKLDAINVTLNTQLKNLSIWNNVGISELDISKNKLLENLVAYGLPNLTEIDVSENILLKDITVNDCNLTEIDVSNNPNLKDFSIGNNSISTLDLSNNPNLKHVSLFNNPIGGYLDMSHATSLVDFDINNCNVTALNLKNGNNTVIDYFDIRGNTNLTCVQVDDTTYSTTNWTNIDNIASYNEDCGYNFSIAPKVILEGAFKLDTGDIVMHDNLRNNTTVLIPTTSPYNTKEFCDETIFNTTGENAIVDWVEVQLRNVTDVSQIEATKSALLLRNGKVVDIDGTSPVLFSRIQENFYVAITHRNHLTVVSESPVSFNSNLANIDFTNTSNVLNGNNALIEVSSSIFALPAGDVNNSGQIQNSGISNTISRLGNSGYSIFDVDMNGQVQNIDINMIRKNLGKGEQIQLPD